MILDRLLSPAGALLTFALGLGLTLSISAVRIIAGKARNYVRHLRERIAREKASDGCTLVATGTDENSGAGL